MKVDSQPFPQANVVELSDFGSEGQNLAFQINMAGPMRRCVEQRKEAASGKRPRMKMSQSSSMSLKNKCVTSATRSQLPIGFWKNTSTSTRCAADMNRKRRSMSTAQGGRWGGTKLDVATGIARSSGTVGIPT